LFFNWAAVPGGRFSNPPTSQSPIVGRHARENSKLKITFMKIKFTLVLIFVLSHCFTKAQLTQTDNWKDYIDYKVDTIAEGYRIVGEYKNHFKQGWWKVYNDNGLITKAFYQKGIAIQTEGVRDNVYYKIYSDDLDNKKYTFRRNEGKIFVQIEPNDKSKQNVGEEVWFSNRNEEILDTSFGLKKIDELNFVDRNDKKYNVSSSTLSITDHELIDEQITTNDEGNYIVIRKKYMLYNNRMISFENSKLKKYQDFSPVYTAFSSAKERYSLKSERKDIFIFNNGSSNNAVTYSVVIDNKPVLEGSINSSGMPQGIWNLYHFTYFDVQDEKRTAAFSATNLFEFSKIMQGDAPWINMYYFKDMFSLSLSDVANALTQEYLNKIEKDFSSINEPYLLTKYSTFTKSGTDLNLKDNLGYHLFQKLYYNEGKLTKGYQFTPDGKVYDSINFNKDEFGETITKNTTFKAFPEHPMAQAYQKQLVDGIKMLLNTATKYLEDKNQDEWKNTKCKYCNKSVDYSSSVIVDGITCGNTRYPGGGIFCSSKCRYDYEIGYCRNK
jgi:hypothetical protein